MGKCVRVAVATVIALCLVGPGVSSAALFGGGKFPSKPIEYVVQSSPGGGSDTFVRVISDILSKEKLIAATIVVMNKAGGGGAVAYKYTASKAGDGHFLQNLSSNFITTPLVSKDCPGYKEFTPIMLLAYEPIAVVVKASSPFKTVKDLVEASKTKPGGITWAHTSVGNFDHLLAMLVAKKSGAKVVGLPVTADNDVLVSVMGGHAEVGSISPRGALGQVRAGEMRILAFSTPGRLPNMSDVPTLKEVGVDVVLATPRGVVAPKGIPEEAKAYLSTAFQRMTQSERWKKFLTDEWLIAANLSGGDFDKWLKEESDKVEPVLKEVGLIK